jgi:hypothetical protein
MTYAPYDAQTELRALSAGQITSTGATTPLAITGKTAGDFKAVIDVTVIDRTTGDETYVFGVEADTAVGFSTPVAVATLPAITTAGLYEIPLSAALIEQHKAGATHLRLKATLGGTSPILTYGARLVPNH